MKKIFFPYTVIEVHLEPIQFFIEKLERGENYHFLRINHGIIDQFVKVPQDKIEKLVEDKNYDMLSEEVYNSNEVYRLRKSFHGESETIIDKLKAFTRLAFDKNLSSRFIDQRRRVVFSRKISLFAKTTIVSAGTSSLIALITFAYVSRFPMIRC